jgi:hypothetical protein
MGFENAGVVTDLDETWPLATDPRAEGDDHIRMLKLVLKGLVSDPSQVESAHIDGETPSGGSVGSTELILAWTPRPLGSLILARNGVIQRQGTGLDYTIVANTITLTVAVDTSEWFLAWYRY